MGVDSIDCELHLSPKGGILNMEANNLMNPIQLHSKVVEDEDEDENSLQVISAQWREVV